MSKEVVQADVIPIVDANRMGRKVRSTPKGRSVDPQALAEVQALLGEEPRRADLLIEYLHRIQDRFGCIGSAHVVALAAEMKLAMTEVYEVATFYHHFDVIKDREPRPPSLTVRVCESLACEMAGARELMAELAGRVGADVRVVGAPCVGRCESAPVAVVGRNPLERASAQKVTSAIARKHTSAPEHEVVTFAQYRAAGGYKILSECLSGARDAESVISAMEGSGLRGLGGAGFPAGRKWRIVRAESAPRLMAVNIDEGEPGTFKDRFYLERDPHRFLEGMLIAAWAAGVGEIYIYLRDEYAGCRQTLTRELAALQADPPCALPPMHLRRGAGAYICGEESAMIESIEGKRGMPRLRPPYVAQVGLFGYPTLEHNL
jgi:formate dehydrogenase beta subunit